ncbi:hypothetical protein KKE03_03780 [Patescibacteria group bacterium]|nr:hypothetical protein [Patescibacteria group bacterium]
METYIPRNQILELLKGVCQIFNGNKIVYLVCGSLAYQLITKEDITIHDIDIIVHEDDFDKLIELLTHSTLDLKPIKTEFSIHVNHKLLNGVDGKSFDISLDSYEHYYSQSGIDLNSYQGIDINGILVKVATIKTMIKVYNTALKGCNVEKFPEYERKIEVLTNI